MVERIDRDGLRRRLADGHAQLVEVLPRSEFEDEHLPGAMNIPLAALGREARSRLDTHRPVIVYCWDQL
jgi:phage shock protein E